MALVGTGALALGSAASADAAVNVSQSGWQWGNPTPQGNTIRAIDFNGGVGYAIGDDGTALRTNDGGATWAGLATGTSQDLTRVQAVTPQVVTILGGDGCVVRRSADGGQTFQKVYVLAEVNCPEKIAAVQFVDANTGYLLTREGNVYKTADGGQTVSRVTAIPGTSAGAGGGTGVPADAYFVNANEGVVFLAGGNRAFRTTDGGASWTPEGDVEPGNVERVRALSATTAYAFGPDTLLQTTDGGQTWKRRGAGNGNHVTGISCAGELCLMSVAPGDKILRSENGGGTAAPIVPATQKILAVGLQSGARAVAAGVGGATAVSDDGGQNYKPVGGDIGGSFEYGLRLGTGPGVAFALGARGQLARTVNGGETWQAINVATSTNIQDASFTTLNEGYALDQRGGLFRTTNGGSSWSPIDPGTTSPPRAVITSGDAVLLAGPRGVRRADGGGAFDLVDSRAVRRAAVDRFDRAGSALFVYGTTTIARTSDRGRTWRAVRGPGRTVRKKFRALRLQDLEMTSATNGYALDVNGRVWRTQNGGRRWSELPGVGTDSGLALAFGSATGGYLTLSEYPAEDGASYVLRTSDGGATWRPQRIATGQFPGTEGVISPSSTKSYALTSTPAAGGNVFRSLFTTSTGGDQGRPSQLARLTTERTRFTRKQLARAGRRVSVGGALAGAQGGEQIVVSARQAGATAWTEQVVTAGANGGRFTATFRGITRTTEFVARWAGDSGRQGAGSRPLVVTVRK